MRRSLSLLLACTFAAPLAAQATSPLSAELDRRIAAAMPRVVELRRDLHEHPELSGQEERTARVVAEQLRRLGLEVRTNVGGHGVVGVLRGGRPGRVVALRSDMDGLPVTEQVDLPFRSRARATFNGQDVGVMHACGHDQHMSILLGAAEVLAGMRAQLPGTVVFIFQPAEEGLPDGTGGAEKMIADGALENPKVEAIFGLHVWPNRAGEISYRPGATMAAQNGIRLTVHGRQTHGANPWGGVDPIVVSSQIVLGLQTIVSRQVNITEYPAIVTIGQVNGGARAGRCGDVLHVDSGYVVTRNDEALTARMLPTLRRANGGREPAIEPLVTAAEDFSFYQQRVPGLFIFLGVTPPSQDWATRPRNHSPLFNADEAALPVGVKAMAGLALDWLTQTSR